MIEISHLVKKYGDHYAVKDLNVRIEEGQIYGFLGPNMCRKGEFTDCLEETEPENRPP